MLLKKCSLFIFTLTTICINAQPLVKELGNLTNNLEYLASSLQQQQPNGDLKLFLERSDYIAKKIEVNSYPVYFLKVLRQSGTDCQLHGLKNALYGINLLEQAPQNIQKNLALLADAKLYKNLLGKWLTITKTCSHVLDSQLDQIMEAIKNQTMPPENFTRTPDHISFFNNIQLYSINDLIIQLFTKNLAHRTALLESKNYLHAFLVSFMYQNRSELNLRGGAQDIFQHTIALIAYKKDDKLLFLAADSWEGSKEYTRQRDSYINDAIHALTMHANDFYLWCGNSFLAEAATYAEKATKNNLHCYWATALKGLRVALYAYKESSALLNEQQKKRICKLTQILLNKKGFATTIQEIHKTLWNQSIEKIKEFLKDLNIEC